MTVGVAGSVTLGSNQLEVDINKAARVSQSPYYTGTAGGRYRGSVSTNLATVISALTATGDVGQIGQFRWADTTKTCLVDRIELEFVDITKAGTLQSIKLGIRKVTAHTATASGGVTVATSSSTWTIATLTGDAFKLRSTYPLTAVTDWRMTDTADLTCGAGARAVDDKDILTLNTRASATAGESIPSRVAWTGREGGGPIVLTANTGLSCLNSGLVWGATLTARVTWSMEWRELLNADVPTNL